MAEAPFPYYGGKSKVASIVWERFGDVKNYVEPFFGSGAVLLNRPHEPSIETINDKDCYVANFWRALKNDPEQVAHYADWPVNEADLQARHTWLVRQEEFREAMKNDADFYDCKVAGWWVWGISAWIGSGWCEIKENVFRKIPHLGDNGRGVHRKRPHLAGVGYGVGVHRKATRDLVPYFQDLAARLRYVRVCCGDWSRITGPSVTFKHGLTGVFLDPPYSAEANRQAVYATEDLSVAHAAREWALANGDNPLMRIALCGYEGEHAMPGWSEVAWKANGGYANRSEKQGRENKHRERIWFSPHCQSAQQLTLLGVQRG